MKLSGLFSGCAVVGAVGAVVGILTVLVFAAGMILDTVGEGGFIFLLLMAFSPLVLWVAAWTYERFGVAKANIEAARLRSQAAAFIEPNTDGLLPVHAGLLSRPDFGAASISVHLARQSGRAQLPMLESVQVAQPAQLTVAPQSFWELFQANKLPAHGFLMGYEDGQEITADWSDLYSALVGGQSGSGKSTLIRSILAQSALQGGRFVVLDKHYGAGAESLGESLQPLRNLMLCDVASNDQQMVDALSYVRDLGEQRLSGASRDKSPVILVVDETTAVLQRSATAAALSDVLGQISQETRKVGVFALCIGQNFHGNIMDTTVRDSFVSFISCRARRNVAKTMTDNNEFGKMAQELAIGQAVWMTPGGDVHKLAVPNCTAHDLDLVATHVFGGKQPETDADSKKMAITPVRASTTASTKARTTASTGPLQDTYLKRHFPKAGPDNGAGPAQAAELSQAIHAERVIAMYKEGHSQNAILNALWNNPVGRAKVEASREFNAIIRANLRD